MVQEQQQLSDFARVRMHHFYYKISAISTINSINAIEVCIPRYARSRTRDQNKDTPVVQFEARHLSVELLWSIYRWLRDQRQTQLL